MLRACKTGKAAWEDLIPYEFYKGLNTQNRSTLLALFNTVYYVGRVPSTWSSLKMFLLFKKGDPGEAENYRSISLMNCITKVFTMLLCNRLQMWADYGGLLYEGQNGFFGYQRQVALSIR